MTTDPFELSQYTTSFDRVDAFSPNALIFADFQIEFSRISEQILARQVAISVGFNVPDIEFAPIDNFEATTPAGVIEAILLFQEAIGEMVTGDIIDRYGRLSNCDIYIGFFHFSNGFPIVGLSQILPNDGQTDWTEPPDLGDLSSVVSFTQAIGDNLNEIIFALNVLKYIHGRMVLTYELDDSCGDAPPPTPPPPTPPTPAPTPPTPAPTPPTPAPTPPTPAPTPPTPAPTPPTPAPTPGPTPPTAAPPTVGPPPPPPVSSNMMNVDGIGMFMVGGTRYMSSYNGSSASWGIKDQVEGNNIEDM